MPINYSGNTTTITGTETFESLKSAISANSNIGDFSNSFIWIKSNISFGSSARLEKGSSNANHLIFGQDGATRRITSQNTSNNNQGVIDFGNEGLLTLNGGGHIGNSQATLECIIEAANLFVNAGFNDSPNNVYADLFFRSNNSREALRITEQLTIYLTNSDIEISIGLLYGLSFTASTKILLGDNSVNPSSRLLVNTNNGGSIPRLEGYGNQYVNRNPDSNGQPLNFTWNEPVVPLSGDLSLATFFGRNIMVRNVDWKGQAPQNIQLSKFSTFDSPNACNWTITYDFEAGTYNLDGWAVEIWDDTETQFARQVIVGDGNYPVRDVVWKNATIDANGTGMGIDRENVQYRFRKKGFKELYQNVGVYDRKLLINAGISPEPEYIDVSAKTKLSNSQEVFSAHEDYLFDNLQQDTFITKNGDTLTTDFEIELLAGTNADPFQVVENKMTIYTGGSFQGNITTTGTVTDTGVAVEGTITDVSGTRANRSITITNIPNGIEARIRLGRYTLKHEQNVDDGDFDYSYVYEGSDRRATISIGGVDNSGRAYERREVPVVLKNENQSFPFEIIFNQSYF